VKLDHKTTNSSDIAVLCVFLAAESKVNSHQKSYFWMGQTSYQI